MVRVTFSVQKVHSTDSNVHLLWKKYHHSKSERSQGASTQKMMSSCVKSSNMSITFLQIHAKLMKNALCMSLLVPVSTMQSVKLTRQELSKKIQAVLLF